MTTDRGTGARGEDADLSRLVTVWAAQRPGRTAIRYDAQPLDYGGLARRVAALTAWLAARGVGRGDRIAWLGPNHPLLFVVLFAACRIGAILAPLNLRLSAVEHARQLADATPMLLLHGAAQQAHLADLAAQAPLPALHDIETLWGEAGNLPPAAATTPETAGRLGDDLLLVYTSGTAGEPKGVVLTQRAILFNALNSIHAHDLTAADHGLIVLPLFHVGGLNILAIPLLYVGGQITLHARFDPGSALADIAALRPTLTALVPAMLAAVIAHPAWAHTDIGSLRMINTGSSRIPRSLIDAWHQRGVPVGQVYGATETAPIAICLRAELALAKAGAAGYPAMHCEVALFDTDDRPVARGETGEIRVRGPNLMRAYFGREQATADAFTDGWFRTGDLARQDEDGCYWIVGRAKDMIISGGENIHPAELEAILADCPSIAEAVVVGLPDDRWGEVPVAVVVRAPGASLDAAAVRALFDGRLARFKHPKRVGFTASLPRTALGKVQKPLLVQWLSGSDGRISD